MKKLLYGILFVIFVSSVMRVTHFQAAAETKYSGFRVAGRFLYDQDGAKVILVGVNKMVIWTDIDGLPSFAEIAKTGANCVRIVWNSEGTAAQLDTAITNCRANRMIPMVEHHGATGAWNDLQNCVDYWLRPDVVAVLQKHQEYLLLNIANECGDGNVAAADFRIKYTAVVRQMRNAGIHVPLIIDGTSWGQNINILQSEGPALQQADPDHNLMFSVHMWWPKMYGYSAQTVIDEIAESVQLGLPLIVGEFGAIWEESEQGKIPYETIIEQCTKNQIGWLAWSWGPGNNPQTFLDMTEDSTYATLHDWGLEVAVTHQYSIKNTAVRPAFLLKPVESATVGPVVSTPPLPTATATSQTTVTPAVTPSPSGTSGPAACSLNYTMQDWGSGATVQITVKNNGATAINGWTAAWEFAGNQKVTNIWNGTCTQNGTAVTVKNMSYNETIPAGGTVNFGFNLSYSGTNAQPTAITLNGAACMTD